MFTNPRPNLLVSDEGFSVRILGRTGIEYRESDRVVTVDSEVLADQGIAIYPDSLRCWTMTRDSVSLGEQDRSRILDNMRRAIEHTGEYVEFIRSNRKS